MANQYIDLSFLKEFSDNDANFIKEYVDDFLQAGPEDLQKLTDAIAAKDWDKTYKVAHNLKSSARYLGMHSIKDVIETVEKNALRKENLDDIPKLFVDIKKVCELALEELKKTSQSLS